jgi:peptide/nickel transport system substrate-binding protein
MLADHARRDGLTGVAGIVDRMRRWTAPILGLGLVLGLAGGAFGETPRDTIVMAKQIDDIISLDPAESFEFSGQEAVANLYDRLLGYDLLDVRAIEGRLAESWSVDEDGRTYRFTLRTGLRFASGNPVTAADAAYSLRRAIALNKSPSFILAQFGLTKENAGDRIRAESASELVIVTAKPVAPSFFYDCLTAIAGSVVDGKVVAAHEKAGDWGNEWLRTNSAGSGPFKLRGWRANESYTLEANESYWGGAPTIHRIVVRHVPEPSTQRLLLEKGDVDYARNLTRDQLAALDGNSDIAVQSARKAAILYLALNQRNPILARPEVREAFKYLVDYEAIEKHILAPGFVIHQSFLPKGILGAINDRPYRFDLARAKDLLARAKLDKGFKVTLDVQGSAPWVDIAQAVQATLGQAGIAVEILPADLRQVISKYRARGHDVAMLLWASDYQDPHSNAQTFATNGDNSDGAAMKTLAWRNGWHIPEMTRLTEAALAARDVARRVAIYEDLQRDHQRVSPFVIMFQQIEVAAHRRAVDGFVMGPSSDTDLYAGLVKH